MIRVISDVNLEGYVSRASARLEQEAAVVRRIIADVRQRGDGAVFELTSRYDGVDVDATNIRVTEEEIDLAYQQVDARLLAALRRAAQNIRNHHEKQKKESWISVKGGRTTGQLMLPMEKVGIYVPGGTAAYPSSVLMNAIPAKVAGVDRIIMCTPPSPKGITPLTLVAAREAGVDEIYRAGGAQAVAAMAYGTQSIPRVDKITGPGNTYVALAKREVFGAAGIDMIAGPSEILIVADKTARAEFVAADMLSQAEHDKMAAAILVTNSVKLAQDTAIEIEKQLAMLPRQDIARSSIENYGMIIITSNIEEALNISNRFAPEHLELMVEDPNRYLGLVRNAGAVFLGSYSPEPLGDYYAGTNHILPTSGSARFFSALSVDDFMKKTSLVSYTQQELSSVSEDIILLAEAEGLDAHANSIRMRVNDRFVGRSKR